MSLIAEKRKVMLQGLVRTLPQTSLRSLEMALGLTHEPRMAEVRGMIAAEMEFRHVREAVFAPYMAFSDTRSDGIAGVSFAPWIVNKLWALLETAEPELLAQARHALGGLRTEDPTPVPFFRLVTAGAQICHTAPESVGTQGEAERAAVAEFGHYLDLHRLARQVLNRLGDYMGRIDAEKATALRLLFKDACDINAESGTRFLEIIFANLDDGAQIIKFVATVSDRPNDRFLAMSELATFGERILDHIERDLAGLKSFMSARGKPACDDLETAGDRVTQCLGQLQAFGHHIELSRDGAWGKRVTEAQKVIADLVEQQLKGAERALEDVLLVRSERVHGRVKRESPDFTQLPPPEATTKAKGTLAFIRKVRNIAMAGGFASLHTKVADACEASLDAYFGELLSIANGDEAYDPDQLMNAFDHIIALMTALCGEEKAVVARRRVASSDVCNPSKHVA